MQKFEDSNLYLNLKDVRNIQRGYHYTGFRKTLKGFRAYLAKTTIRAVDPGCRAIVTVVDLFVQNVDVRKTVWQKLRGAYYRAIGTRKRSKKMKKLRAHVVPAEYESGISKLGKARYDAEAIPLEQEGREEILKDARLEELRLIAEHWVPLRKYASLRQVSESRFQSGRRKQQYLDNVANELMTPRKEHSQMLLIWGNGGSKDGFQSARAQMGPARALYRHVVAKSKRDEKKKCLVLLADEHRTSKCGLFGETFQRPQIHAEGNEKMLARYAKCKRKDKEKEAHTGLHPPGIRGCRCRCATQGCTKKRELGNRCRECYEEDPWTKIGLSIGLDGRMFNRDVAAAISIGCRCLLKLLGMDVGNFEHFTVIAEPEFQNQKTFWECRFEEYWQKHCESTGSGAAQSSANIKPYLLVSKKAQRRKKEAASSAALPLKNDIAQAAEDQRSVASSEESIEPAAEGQRRSAVAGRTRAVAVVPVGGRSRAGR